jgi:signal transduction histidine kinase
MERLRTRIASDLHDDIGSSLSRIAVLSDAVRRKVNGEPGIVPLLSNMAEASREAIDAMGDIVWAVNPKKDHLQDLEQRMRRLAGEMLTEQDLEFSCSSHGELESHTLTPDFKRNVILIFKECLNNVVRHSSASKVSIRLDLNDGELLLKIQDNGKGFDSAHDYDGQGLRNMKKRASELNANLEVSSKPENGAIICLQARIHRGSFFDTHS